MESIKKRILNQRRAGILLHITSLPGSGSCGDLGIEAYNFINFLNTAGISVWQTLPLGMPHGDGSPYQCLSTHAGNPALISMKWLFDKGWMDCVADCTYKDDVQSVLWNKEACLATAFTGFQRHADEADENDYRQFCQDNAWWLDDFALFLALKKEFNQAEWCQWPEHIRNRQRKALKQVQKRLAKTIELNKFAQYIFFRQWHELRKYARQHGVFMFGDIPIFVAYDSADVWAARENFKLDATGMMTVVAGVPPDYFSETGQRWGNPHYNWEYLEKNGFKWWKDRVKTQLEMFDIVRIDHFRGLEAAWEIPVDEETAINGQWVEAPGIALLKALEQEFGTIPLVAEDLGIITPEVEALRDGFKLPGMKILHFAFSGGQDNPYLPHNYPENSVVYTGTHDNDTTLGWYHGLSDQEKHYAEQYLAHPCQSMPYDLINAAMASVANLAVIPMQDVLELGSEHRMNTPGTTEGNWLWRFNWNQLTDERVHRLAHEVGLFGRRH